MVHALCLQHSETICYATLIDPEFKAFSDVKLITYQQFSAKVSYGNFQKKIPLH